MRRADLRRVQAGLVAKGEKRALMGRQVLQRVVEVDHVRAPGRVGLTRILDAEVGQADIEMDEGPRALLATELSGLVGGHGHEPRLEAVRVAQRVQLLPGDGPGGLHGVVRDVLVATGHDVGDADHVGVVRGHDPGERHRVPGRRQLHDRGCHRGVPREPFHVQ